MFFSLTSVIFAYDTLIEEISICSISMHCRQRIQDLFHLP
jgi:hypothetical protein